eukprot:1352693-Prymnesium_polylepis.1
MGRERVNGEEEKSEGEVAVVPVGDACARVQVRVEGSGQGWLVPLAAWLKSDRKRSSLHCLYDAAVLAPCRSKAKRTRACEAG